MFLERSLLVDTLDTLAALVALDTLVALAALVALDTLAALAALVALDTLDTLAVKTAKTPPTRLFAKAPAIVVGTEM